MSKITKVVSRQIFDSRGIPTIETEIFCGKVSSRAICPSGASTQRPELPPPSSSD